MPSFQVEDRIFEEAILAGLLVTGYLSETMRTDLIIRLLDRLGELQIKSAPPCEIAIYTGFLTALGFSDLSDLSAPRNQSTFQQS